LLNVAIIAIDVSSWWDDW